MNALEICHHFAAESYGPRGTRRAGNVSAEQHNRTLYSYAAPIARFTGNPALPVLITSRTYSAMTSKHTTLARRALHHLRPFEVWNIAAQTQRDHADNVRSLFAESAAALKSAARSRIAPDTREREIARAIKLATDAEIYRKAFAVPVKSLAPIAQANRKAAIAFDPANPGAAFEALRTADQAERARRDKETKAREKREAKARAEQEERDRTRREEWLAGAGTYYPREHYSAPARLRVIENAVETSHGARVHVRDAARLWPLAERAHRTGTTYKPEPPHKVGAYTLYEVRPDGVTIGCHVISFDEMQRVKDAVMAAAALHQDETADA